MDLTLCSGMVIAKSIRNFENRNKLRRIAMVVLGDKISKYEFDVIAGGV